MRAAQLNRYIIIEVATMQKNNLGTPTENYTEYKRTWASVNYPAGRMDYAEHGEIARTDAVFTIRYDKNITYKHRVYYNSQYYKIEHIEEIGRREGLRLRTIMFIDEPV